MTPVVYAITFRDGSVYVGCTCNFQARKHTHLRNSRRGQAVNVNLAQAFQANPAPDITVVASGFDRATLHLLEQQVMDQYNATLNVARATPVAKPTDGTPKPFGPYASVAEFARAEKLTYQTAKNTARTVTYEQYRNPPKVKLPPQPATHPPDPRNNPHLIWHGSWYSRKAVRRVSVSIVKTRRKAGWSDWDALTTPATPTTKCHLADGVSYDKYYYRKMRGWDHAQAAGFEPRPEKEPAVNRKTLTAAGRTLTMDQWAKELAIPKGRLSGRIWLKWTAAQCVGLEPPPLRKGAQKHRAEAAARAERRVHRDEIKKAVQRTGMTPHQVKRMIAAGVPAEQVTAVPAPNYFTQLNANFGPKTC